LLARRSNGTPCRFSLVNILSSIKKSHYWNGNINNTHQKLLWILQFVPYQRNLPWIRQHGIRHNTGIEKTRHSGRFSWGKWKQTFFLYLTFLTYKFGKTNEMNIVRRWLTSLIIAKVECQLTNTAEHDSFADWNFRGYRAWANIRGQA
jgi:hypothetical protein